MTTSPVPRCPTGRARWLLVLGLLLALAAVTTLGLLLALPPSQPSSSSPGPSSSFFPACPLLQPGQVAKPGPGRPLVVGLGRQTSSDLEWNSDMEVVADSTTWRPLPAIPVCRSSSSS